MARFFFHPIGGIGGVSGIGGIGGICISTSVCVCVCEEKERGIKAEEPAPKYMNLKSQGV